jgi:hypothetical protein
VSLIFTNNDLLLITSTWSPSLVPCSTPRKKQACHQCPTLRGQLNRIDSKRTSKRLQQDLNNSISSTLESCVSLHQEHRHLHSLLCYRPTPRISFLKPALEKGLKSNLRRSSSWVTSSLIFLFLFWLSFPGEFPKCPEPV